MVSWHQQRGCCCWGGGGWLVCQAAGHGPRLAAYDREVGGIDKAARDCIDRVGHAATGVDRDAADVGTAVVGVDRPAAYIIDDGATTYVNIFFGDGRVDGWMK